MTDVQRESIRVQITFAQDDDAPLTEVIRNQQDVLELLDFALFLTHGDVVRWTNGGGRGQIRLARLDHGSPVEMDIDMVMSGGLGLTHGDAHAGVTAAGTVLLTAARSHTGVPDPERSDRQRASDAEKHVLEAMERVAYDARGTDLAWRIREAEQHNGSTPEGTTGKGLRFVRAAARLSQKDGIDFRME
ncbi:hypothetical protein [Curtobacterium sp. Leaf183]|uniref:hypothetical protein n=1 Tax=Curtobacterium sp. Leaf183 TaxID=1736291 RepID=UPI000AE5BE28|nr:hypothetical protein [Curtobacterium sp. Leaf183]